MYFRFLNHVIKIRVERHAHSMSTIHRVSDELSETGQVDVKRGQSQRATGERTPKYLDKPESARRATRVRGYVTAESKRKHARKRTTGGRNKALFGKASAAPNAVFGWSFACSLVERGAHLLVRVVGPDERPVGRRFPLQLPRVLVDHSPVQHRNNQNEARAWGCKHAGGEGTRTPRAELATELAKRTHTHIETYFPQALAKHVAI